MNPPAQWRHSDELRTNCALLDMISPRKAPALCRHRRPVTLQTLKDAQENNSREITGAATDRVAMNCCEHKNQRAGELCINKIRLKCLPHLTLLVSFILTRTWTRWMSEANHLKKYIFFRFTGCWAGINKKTLHSYSLIPLQFCAFCHFLSWVCEETVPESSLSPHRSPACHFHTIQRCRLPCTCTHTCTHVPAAHFI